MTPLELAAWAGNAQVARLDRLFRDDPTAAMTQERAQIARSRCNSERAGLMEKVHRASVLSRGFAAERDCVIAKAKAVRAEMIMETSPTCAARLSSTWQKLERRADVLDEAVYVQRDRLRQLQAQVR